VITLIYRLSYVSALLIDNKQDIVLVVPPNSEVVNANLFTKLDTDLNKEQMMILSGDNDTVSGIDIL